MSIEDERIAPRIGERAALHREREPAFARWAKGHGLVRHLPATQVRVHDMVADLEASGLAPAADLYTRLAAADRVTSAAMWLVAHATYADRVRLDGVDLEAEDFKACPEGHMGGALNMVPAYVGYLLANALAGTTRAWLMGQGHCVAAIDAANVLVGNTLPEHAERYGWSDAGLTRFVRDFYRYDVRADGRPSSPLGSHVNAHTAGGIIEGGYLGFAELEYVHMPLPGERLVAFLSDGAFEEQRGGDWAPRWWRASDSGLVSPILIANGRRIDQRTTVAQSGGVEWLRDHLRLNGFDPLDIDGRDPAAFAWAIFECEAQLAAAGAAAERGEVRYPVRLPYVIAETEKGWGFYGAGSNAAHNLPLIENPATDARARARFRESARALWVAPDELAEAVERLATHAAQRRPRERDHALLRRDVAAPVLPEPGWIAGDGPASPMGALDRYFTDVVAANPRLRARLANPDELRSNGMNASLDALKHRVTAPEPGVAEALDGRVITALNEEAVICAALANKGGINLCVTYEAFAVKMLGALRQQIIFARHQREVDRPARWIAVPLVVTSHTWENGKNEQSHQDPTLCEALLGEMNDVSRVLFPCDANSALAALEDAYAERGQIWTLVVPKRALPVRLGRDQARALVRDGALRLRGGGGEPLVLTAIGAYQLDACLRASDRLTRAGVAHGVVYLLEPGRFRDARDPLERVALAAPATRAALFPAGAGARVFVTHTRPEPLLGALRPLDTGARTRALGFLNRGGTLDTFGMCFANRTTWAHVLVAAAEVADLDLTRLLSAAERAAAGGHGDPAVLR